MVALAALAATARIRLGGRWHAVLGIEIGHSLVGLEVRAASRRGTGIGGPFSTLRLGIAYER